MNSDENFSGDLSAAPQPFLQYFAHDLQKLADHNGGDLMVFVQLDRGDEYVGYQYREGRYVTTQVTSDYEGDPMTFDHED